MAQNVLPAVALAAATTAVTTTATAAAKSTASATTTATRAGLLRARFIDGQRTAAEIGAVQSRNSRLSF
jgi:hypothetical protein